MPRVHILNPGSHGKKKKSTRRKTNKKPGRKPAHRKPMAKKKSTKRKSTKRKSNPTTALRRRAPARKKKRKGRRRKNPIGAKDVGAQLKRWGPFFAGKLWVAYAVRRWGNLGGSPGQLLGGGPIQSQFAGQSWALGQYVVAGLALWVGGKLARMVNLDVSQFRAGCYDAIFTKLIWTEGIARSPTAKAAFGNIRYNPRTGQKWMSTGRGRYVAMQGFGDELVTASALDGGRPMGDELVHASALDGPRNYGYVQAQGSSTDPFRSAYV